MPDIAVHSLPAVTPSPSDQMMVVRADTTLALTTATARDGADGKDGAPGADGQDGAPGANGLPGADGQDGALGSGDPAPTLGDPADHYLDGEAGWVWVKRTDTSWTNLYVNLTGPPGEGAGEHDHDYLPLTGGTLTGDLQVDGDFNVGTNDNFQVYSNGTVRSTAIANKSAGAIAPNVFINTVNNTLYRSEWTPSRMAFAPSKLARNSDVLGRAETATLPPEMETDDEGNQTNTAEIEAHDTIQLFDVVTALLAKVKEQGEQITTLTERNSTLGPPVAYMPDILAAIKSATSFKDLKTALITLLEQDTPK